MGGRTGKAINYIGAATGAVPGQTPQSIVGQTTQTQAATTPATTQGTTGQQG